MDITRINEDIYKLVIPYYDIFTTVYTVRTPDGVLLFDTATYESDVNDYILPFLEKIGVSKEEIKYVFISHNHWDHAGGIRYVMSEFPDACIVSRSPVININHANYKCLNPEDGCTIMDFLKVIAIPGHTLDSAAIWDTRTNILITGPCLQLYGIFGSGLWGANINFPKEHIEAVKKLYNIPISAIYAAHDYHPCGTYAVGEAEVTAFLDNCIYPIETIKKLLDEKSGLTDSEIAETYNSQDKLPTLGAHVVTAVRHYVYEDSKHSADKLKSDLIKLGIRPGDTILMHSSYKALGGMEGGAEAFFKAFKELLGSEGTLVVPTLSFDTVTMENPVFDADSTPSCVGYLSEFFRTKVDGVIRSMHATHSCCAWGKHASQLVADHEKDLTPVGENSPFTKLPQFDGKILMLGCGLRCNTSMHGVEEVAEPPYCIDRTQTVQYKLVCGEEVIMQNAYRHNFNTDSGEHIAQRYDRMEELLDRTELKHGYVLSAESFLIDARALWQKGSKKLMEDPLCFVDYPREK